MTKNISKSELFKLIFFVNFFSQYIGSKETDEKADMVFRLGIMDLWTPENHYHWSKSRYGSHVSGNVQAVDRSRLLLCSMFLEDVLLFLCLILIDWVLFLGQIDLLNHELILIIYGIDHVSGEKNMLNLTTITSQIFQSRRKFIIVNNSIHKKFQFN